MHRRTALAAASGLLVGVAGCLDDVADDDPAGPNDDDGDDSEDDEDDGQGNEDAPETDDDEGSPDPVFEIEDETLEAPQDETVATLTNEGDDTLLFNPYRWELEKSTDGDWERIAPWEWEVPEASLEPGEERTRTIEVDHDATDHRALGPGTYRYEYASQRVSFEVVGPDLDLEAEDVVDRDDEDGTPVAITQAARDAIDDPEEDPERIVFERAAGGGRTVLAEHVVQNHALRNGLPLLLGEALEELVCYAAPWSWAEAERTVLQRRSDDDRHRIEFEGEPLAVEITEYDGQLE